jgi:hypothetical protein
MGVFKAVLKGTSSNAAKATIETTINPARARRGD